MSYFQTLNQFVDTAEASRQHSEEFTKELRDETANSFMEKIEAKQNEVGEFAGAIQGGSDAFHMGRKIFHHIKLMKEKSRGKTTTQEEAEEPKAEAEAETIKEEPEPLHATIKTENQDSSLNPFSKDSIDAPSKPELIPQEGEISRATQQPAESYAEDATNRVMSSGNKIESTTEEPAEIKSSLDEGLEAFQGKAGQLGAKAESGVSELMDGSNAIASGVKQAGGKIVANIGKSVGLKAGEDVGEGLMNSVLDGVPILGEVVGLSTLFGNLFHSIHAKSKELAESKVKAAGVSAPTSVSGGINIKSVLGEGSQSTLGGVV